MLGGGRVKTLGCEYCGAILDAQDNFKILAQYQNPRRPPTPFMLGQTGVIDGVEWVIIGTLGYRETYRGKTWDWVDHQLYSPTHGYCFLSWEDEHFIFTRKVRGPGNQGFFDTNRIERAESRPVIYRGGKRYAYYDSGDARVTYAEGSFNWVPVVGDINSYFRFLGDTNMVTHIIGETENEVELSHYLDPNETVKAFGVTGTPFPIGIHPLQPYIPWQHSMFARNAALAFGVLGIVLWWILVSMGTIVLDVSRFDPRPGLADRVGLGDEADRMLSFTINNIEDLVEIRLRSNASNAWAWYDLELINPSGDTVAEFGRLTEYYSGTEDDEVWSEGSRTATARLRLKERGVHKLYINQSESGTWNRGRAPSALDVRVTEGKKSTFWMLLAALICAGASAGIWLKRLWHTTRRWSGSDWSNED